MPNQTPFSNLLLKPLQSEFHSVKTQPTIVKVLEFDLPQVFFTVREHDLHPSEVFLGFLPQLGVPTLYKPTHIQVFLQFLDPLCQLEEMRLGFFLLFHDLCEGALHILEDLVKLPLLDLDALHKALNFKIELIFIKLPYMHT